MKLIIDIDNDVYERIKNGYPEPNDCYKCQDEVLYGKPYEEKSQGDLISREALRKEVAIMFGDKTHITESVCELIDNAPTVEPFERIGLICEENCGYRPQGEYVDISKLRLMTVEECAGHTIDYALGWKACIEWIKKGGADNEHL